MNKIFMNKGNEGGMMGVGVCLLQTEYPMGYVWQVLCVQIEQQAYAVATI